MKKIFSLALCAAMLASALASCASNEGRLDPAITLTSSDARANAEWLDNRLDEIPDDVVIGIGADAECGIDPDNLLDIVRNTKMYDLKDTCEEEAWKYWKSWRGDLTPEGTVQRPAPEKYTKEA